MAFNADWEIEKYREEHDSEEHWLLRKAFMERWQENYPEDRLVCLARVFYNIEIMGCRYPEAVMKEVATLAKEVTVLKHYRYNKKTKLQRTFVSASDAAEDRAKGIKREGGTIKKAPPPKKPVFLNFVKQGEENHESKSDDDASDSEPTDTKEEKDEKICSNVVTSTDRNIYLEDMVNVKCADISMFTEYMFNTQFGRLVLLIRPWLSRLANLQASCNACHIPLKFGFENRCFSIYVNGQLVAETHSEIKHIARSGAEVLAWNILRTQVISVLVKEQFIAQGDARISVSDISGSKGDTFGTPIESSVANKMMQMMGWKGGGLGAEAQGITEPIKPQLRLVNRGGLGSTCSDIRQLRRAAQEMMQRYIASSSLDVDLIFSSDFSKDERAALHQCAQRAGLASKSYGSDTDRFLVVKKKLNPFAIVKAAIEEGGNTAKYQVFIPAVLGYYTPPVCQRQ